MTNSLVLRDHKLRELLHQARTIADHARSPNTLRTYHSLWRDFEQYGLRYQANVLPAAPALIVSYLTELASESGQKVSTLETRLAAIRHFHLQARFEDPTQDPAVRDVLSGLQRTLGQAPDRKAPVELVLLKEMLAAQPDDLRGARNRAILLLGFACGLRRSELVALTLDDVQFRHDEMLVTVRRSKTDQTRKGYEIHVPRQEDKQICPVHALETWLATAGIQSGALFRKIDRWEHVAEEALTAQYVAVFVKKAAAANGLNPKDFGGHSLRRGLITQAARNQESSSDIRKVSRHKTEIMLDVYRADAAEAQRRVIGDALHEPDAK